MPSTSVNSDDYHEEAAVSHGAPHPPSPAQPAKAPSAGARAQTDDSFRFDPANPLGVSEATSRARASRRSQEMQERIAQRVNAATGTAPRPVVHPRSSDAARADQRIDRTRPSVRDRQQARDLRHSSDKFRAALAAVVVLVVLLGLSQMFRAGEGSSAGGGRTPSAGMTQGFVHRTSYVEAVPSPAKLAPQGAPLHREGRDYQMEELIERQKRWAATVDLSKRDAWFRKGKTTSWNFEPNGHKVVYLTFDDGPSPRTPEVLEVLERYGAKATFFVTKIDPDCAHYVKQAYDAGHTIGLHTATHDYAYVYSSEYGFFEDLASVGDMVESQIGYVPAFTRFPGGSSNTISANYVSGIMSMLVNEVVDAGYQYYDWNADDGDALGGLASVEEIVDRACAYDDENLIMLLHDAEPKTTTVEALPAIIEHYLRLGYRFEALTPDSMVYHHDVIN